MKNDTLPSIALVITETSYELEGWKELVDAVFGFLDRHGVAESLLVLPSCSSALASGDEEDCSRASNSEMKKCMLENGKEDHSDVDNEECGRGSNEFENESTGNCSRDGSRCSCSDPSEETIERKERMFVPRIPSPTSTLPMSSTENQGYRSLENTMSTIANVLGRPIKEVSFSIVRCSSEPTDQISSCTEDCQLHILNPTTLKSTYLSTSLVLLNAAAIIKETTGSLCVGYTLKPSRQTDLISQGFLPFNPGLDRIFFVPVHPDVAMYPSFLSCLDILLLKPTDFLERFPGSGTVPPFKRILHELEESVRKHNPRAVIVGSLNTLDIVMDRGKMAEAIDKACKDVRLIGYRARSAAWKVVDKLDIDSLDDAAIKTGVHIPCFIKPVLACGNVEAHAMAVLLNRDGLRNLSVPSPALIQEYINHGGVLWKVYVAGSDIFVIRRRSLPDLPVSDQNSAEDISDVSSNCKNSTEHLQLYPLFWKVDNNGKGTRLQQWSTTMSPKSRESVATETNPMKMDNCLNLVPLAEDLPIKICTRENLRFDDEISSKTEIFRALASALEQEMGLMLFGFDVLFDRKDGSAVVVDVNFFPSYKNIVDAPCSVHQALLLMHRDH